MKYHLHVNQFQCVKLGMKNIQQAHIFDLLTTVSQWANTEIINGVVYYWVARSKIVEELIFLDLKENTVWRYLKSLDELGLIEYKKQGVKDCIKVTTKGKTYSSKNTDLKNNSNELKDEKKFKQTRKIIQKDLKNNSTYTTTNDTTTNDTNKKQTKKSVSASKSDFTLTELEEMIKAKKGATANTKEATTKKELRPLHENSKTIISMYPKKCPKFTSSKSFSTYTVNKNDYSDVVKKLELLIRSKSGLKAFEFIKSYIEQCVKNKDAIKGLMPLINSINKGNVSIEKEESSTEKKKKLYIWSWYGQAKITGTKEKYEKDKKFYGVGGCDADFITHQIGE